MVVGLLTLAAIPTTIAVAQGISAQKNQSKEKKENKLLRKFTLSCYCEGLYPEKPNRLEQSIHNCPIILADNKVWIRPRTSSQAGHAFCGFYIQYPDEQRPPPLPRGLVTTISDDPPMLNWIYVDKNTLELKHGNRTQSIAHRVGNWGYNNGVDEDEIMYNEGNGVAEEAEEEDPGGLTFQRKEQFVAIQPQHDEDEVMWEVRWDQKDDLLKDMEAVKGRKVLRVSLERIFMEPPKE